MRFLNERRTLNKNKTFVDVNNKQEVRNNEGELKQVMAPWLLPVLVAVAMLIFLAISFSLHHKRLVKHRRRTSQYYTLRYHRVAGPIFTCTTGDLECGNNNEDDLEEQDTPARLAKHTSFSFKNKLGRYNTWSPRIFKHKIAAHIAHKKRQASLKNQQNEILQIVDQLKNVTEGDNQEVEMVSRLGSLLAGQPQLTSSELLSLADLTGLTRSYSCRARAVGVTTYTGTLAIAEHNEDNQAPAAGDTVLASSCNTSLASPFRSAALTCPPAETDQQVTAPFEKMSSSCFSNSVMQQVDEEFVFNFDINDEMFTARSRKVSHANLPRYLEDDWTIPAAFVAKPCSHLARSISSYDETQDYTSGFSPKLPHRWNTVDSYGDVQTTIDDATGLFSNPTLKFESETDYNEQINVSNAFGSCSDVANETFPLNDTSISSPGQAEVSSTTSPDTQSSTPSYGFKTTIVVSLPDENKENISSFKQHQRNYSGNTIKDKQGAEINGNIFPVEYLPAQYTNSEQGTDVTEGYDAIVTSSNEDCGFRQRVHLEHTTVNKCCSNPTLSKSHSEELSKILTIATPSETGELENQPRNSTFKNINDACSTDTLTSSNRLEEFSKCSIFVTGSGKVDFGDPCKSTLGTNSNRTIASNGAMTECNPGAVTAQRSDGNTVMSDTATSDHTRHGGSMKSSSTDFLAPPALETGATRNKILISLLDNDKDDSNCGHRMYAVAGSLSDTNIKSLSTINRQRKTKGNVSQQMDRSCSVFCDSWEDGVDRDYMDKSLVSLHKFVVN